MHSLILKVTSSSTVPSQATVACEGTVELEVTLSISECILTLLVNSPTEAEFQLMGALGPRNSVAELIIIRLVHPRGPVRGVLAASNSCELNGWDPGVGVGPCEEPVEGKSARRRNQTSRNEVDPVTVIVERRFVQQRGADDISRMHHGAVGGVSKGIRNRRNVVATPLGRSVGLRDLLRDPVPEHRKLAAELVIDSGNLFRQVGGRVVAALEIHSTGWRREDPAVLAAGRQQSCSIGRDRA